MSGGQCLGSLVLRELDGRPGWQGSRWNGEAMKEDCPCCARAWGCNYGCRQIQDKPAREQVRKWHKGLHRIDPLWVFSPPGLRGVSGRVCSPDSDCKAHAVSCESAKNLICFNLCDLLRNHCCGQPRMKAVVAIPGWNFPGNGSFYPVNPAGRSISSRRGECESPGRRRPSGAKPRRRSGGSPFRRRGRAGRRRPAPHRCRVRACG